jgi:ABC-type multidrug transport system permease subunit
LNPLWQLTLVRLKEFFREPAAVFWVYGFPLLLAVSLGIAFRDRPVEKITVDVVADAGDEAGVRRAEAVLALLAQDERIRAIRSSSSEARTRLRTAKTGLIIEVAPSDAKPAAEWSYTLDPNRPECVLARSAVETVRLRSLLGSSSPVPDQTLDEPGGRYIDFLIPGLIGTNLMGGGLFGVGFVIVDMRVRKLLKRYLATPMKRHHFLLSLMFSRLVFMIIEIAILVGFAYFAFDIRVHGNPFAFAFLILLGGYAFAGLGLLIASRAKTIETVSGLMNAIMLPMYVVSGVFFPSDRFPDFVQPIIRLLPLTAINDGLRAVMNEGAGFAALGFPAAILLAWGTIAFTLALRWFRWS